MDFFNIYDNKFTKSKKEKEQNMIIMPAVKYNVNLRVNNFANGKIFCILDKKNRTIDIYQDSHREYGKGKKIYHRFSYKIDKNNMEILSKKKLKDEKEVENFIINEENLPQPFDGKLNISTCCLKYDMSTNTMNISNENDKFKIENVDTDKVNLYINDIRLNKDYSRLFRLGLILIKEDKIKKFIAIVEQEKNKTKQKKLEKEVELLYEIAKKINNKKSYYEEYQELQKLVNEADCGIINDCLKRKIAYKEQGIIEGMKEDEIRGIIEGSKKKEEEKQILLYPKEPTKEEKYLVSFNKDTERLEIFVKSDRIAQDKTIYFKLAFNVKKEDIEKYNNLENKEKFLKLISELKPENITVATKTIELGKEKQIKEMKVYPHKKKDFTVKNEQKNSILEIINNYFPTDKTKSSTVAVINFVKNFNNNQDNDIKKNISKEAIMYLTEEQDIDVALEKIDAIKRAIKNNEIYFEKENKFEEDEDEDEENKNEKNNIGEKQELHITDKKKEEINKAFLEDYLDDNISMESTDNSKNLLVKLFQKQSDKGYSNALKKYGINGRLSKEAFTKAMEKEGGKKMLDALADKLDIDKEVNDMDTLVEAINEKVKDSEKFKEIKQNIKQKFQEKQNKRNNSWFSCCYSEPSITEEEFKKLTEEKIDLNLNNSDNNVLYIK